MGKLVDADRSARKILLATTVLPGACASGGEIVTSRFVHALRKLKYSVTIIGYGRRGYSAIEGEKVVEVRQIETQELSAHALSYGLVGYLRGRALSVQKYVGSAYVTCLLHELKSAHWDAIIIDHAQMAWILPYLKSQKCIYVCHNNESLLYKMRAMSTSGLKKVILAREAAIMRGLECTLATSCTATWTLTRSDANYFESLGATNVKFFAIPSFISHQTSRVQEPNIDVALLGTWTWAPNRAGLDWFCKEILPLLPLHFNIIIGGSGADYLKDRYPNVNVVGRVPNAAEFLANAKCIAIPSVQGTGVQIKTLDAIATGRPIVATTIALREIESPPSRVYITDDGSDFAGKLRNFVSNPPYTEDDFWTFDREEQFLTKVKDALLMAKRSKINT